MTEALTSPAGVLVLLVLLAAAAAMGALWAKTQAETRHRHAEQAEQEQRAHREAEWQHERGDLATRIARVEGQLEAEVSAHTQTKADLDWQRRQNGELDKRILPMREAFEQLDRSVKQTEQLRVIAQTELQDKVTAMAKQFSEATADVRHEARKLSQVLSRSERRGAWGEMQLRRLVESAGMLPHVHFLEQDHHDTEAGVLRPDMVIDLAGGRKVVVDSKVPLDTFLRMDESGGEANSEAVLQAHAQAVAQHVRTLASKEYWSLYDSPEFVIMFVPSEGLLSSALAVKPDLLQTALDRRVILASPATLLSMLHAITHSWRQVEAADQAREIQELGTELYKRLLLMAERFGKLGGSISHTVKAYDETVATLESRVLPAGRKLHKTAVGGTKPLPSVAPLDKAARSLDPVRWPDPEGDAAAAPPDEPASDRELEAVELPEPVADPQELRPAKRATGRHSAA